MLSSSFSTSDLWLFCRNALDRVSARYVSLPGQYLITTSHCCNRSRRCWRRLVVEASGLVAIDTSGLFSLHMQDYSSTISVVMVVF